MFAVLSLITALFVGSAPSISEASNINAFDEIGLYPSLLNTTYNDQSTDKNYDYLKGPFSSVGVYLGPIPSSVLSSDEGASLKNGLISMSSNSAFHVNYSSLKNKLNYSTGSKNDTLYQYARFGYALKSLGYDNTKNDAFSSNLGVKLGLLVLKLFIIIADMLASLQTFLIKVLLLINPAIWFQRITVGFYKNALDGTVQLNDTAIAALSKLDEYMNLAFNLSWSFIIPIMLGLGLIHILTHRTSQFSEDRFKVLDGFKKPILTMFWIFIGFPLTLSVYTSALNLLSSDAESDASSIYDTMAYTMLDFGKWAVDMRLAMPTYSVSADGYGTITYTFEIASVDSNDSNNTGGVGKVICYYNGEAYGDDDDDGLVPFYTIISNDETVLLNLTPEQAFVYAVNVNTGAYPKITSSDNKSKQRAAVFAMMDSYGAGESVTSADISSSTPKTTETDGDEFYDSIDNFSDVFDGSDGAYTGSKHRSSSDKNIFNNGALAHKSHPTTDGYVFYNSDETDIPSQSELDSDGSGSTRLQSYGLSSAAMYQYLATDFGSDAATVYTSNGGSEYSSLHHRSIVTPAAGTNIFSAICELLARILTSVVIAILLIYTVLAQIKRTGAVLGHGIGSIFGSKREMLMVISTLVSMIASIVIVFIASTVLTSVGDTIQAVVESAFESGDSSTVAFWSKFISSVIMIALSIFSIKYVRTVSSTLDNIVAQITQKMVQTGSGGYGGGAGSGTASVLQAAKDAYKNDNGLVADGKDAFNNAKNKATDMGHKIGDKASDISDGIKDKATKTKDAAKSTYDKMPKSMADVQAIGGNVADSMHQLKRDAKTGLANASEAAKDIGHGVKTTVKNAPRNTRDAAIRARNKLNDNLNPKSDKNKKAIEANNQKRLHNNVTSDLATDMNISKMKEERAARRTADGFSGNKTKAASVNVTKQQEVAKKAESAKKATAKKATAKTTKSTKTTTRTTTRTRARQTTKQTSTSSNSTGSQRQQRAKQARRSKKSAQLDE